MVGRPCQAHTTPPLWHRFNFPGPTPLCLWDLDSVTLHNEDISRDNEPLTCGTLITWVKHVSGLISLEITPYDVTESASPPCTPPLHFKVGGALVVGGSKVPRHSDFASSLCHCALYLFSPPLSSTTPTRSSFALLSSPGILWHLRDPSMRFQRRCSSTSPPTSRPRPAPPWTISVASGAPALS